MAFTTMHFAVGMTGAGVLSTAAALLLRRGWRWLPIWMTAGGVWACVPDMPRLFREDFPTLPFASTLGDKTLERSLHAHGDWFFFHHMLDAQPREFALHGLLALIGIYTCSCALLAIKRGRHQLCRLDESTETQPCDIVARITPEDRAADTGVA